MGDAFEVLSLEKLREADPTSLHFTPWGLGGPQSAETAAEFLQDMVAGLTLADAVAGGTRQSFDRLRRAFGYGVLFYDLFTIVHDSALLVIEQALRDRFIDFHHGTVHFEDSNAAPQQVTAERFEQLLEVLREERLAAARTRRHDEVSWDAQ